MCLSMCVCLYKLVLPSLESTVPPRSPYVCRAAWCSTQVWGKGGDGGESEVNKAEHTRENLKNIPLYQTLELAHQFSSFFDSHVPRCGCFITRNVLTTRSSRILPPLRHPPSPRSPPRPSPRIQTSERATHWSRELHYWLAHQHAQLET